MFDRIVCLQIVLALGTLLSSAADAYTLTDKDGRFTIEMPDKPAFEKRRMKNAGGGYADSHEWMVEQPKPDFTWMMAYRDHQSPSDGTLPEFVYDIAAKQLVSRPGRKLLSRNFIEHDGIRGLELLIDAEPLGLVNRMRIFVVGQRVYTVVFVGPPGSEKAAGVEAYFNSLHVKP